MNRILYRALGLLLAVSAPAGAVETVPLQEGPPVRAVAPDDEIPSESLILVRFLRAEAAWREGDGRTARRLLNEIAPWIPEGHLLYGRLRQLQAELQAGKPSRQAAPHAPVVVASEPVDDGFISAEVFSASRPHVVLLPLSGTYGAAGQAVLEALKRSPAFRPLEVIDTALFSPAELKSLVEAYDPAWVLGPLRPSVAAGLAQAGGSWPMLLLASRCPDGVAECAALVPSPQRTFVRLSRNHLTSRSLLLADREVWMKVPLLMREPIMALAVETLMIGEQRLYDQLQEALNVEASMGRIRWLRKQLGRAVVAFPRAREDFEQVVVFGSAQQAYEVASLLRYWNLSAGVVWFPGTFPSPRQMRRLLPTWPETTAYLPPFLFNPDAYDDKLGIFHAIGQSAARLLAARPAEEARLPVGWLEPVDGGWRITLRPALIEAGQIEPR